MTSLESIKEVRDTMKSTQLLIGIIFLFTIAISCYLIWLKANPFMGAVCGIGVGLSAFSYWMISKKINVLDDFMVFHALKLINSKEKGRYSEVIKFPKAMGIKKKDVELAQSKLRNPKSWYHDETKTDFILIYDKKLEEKYYGVKKEA